jgi:hypothetical protein
VIDSAWGETDLIVMGEGNGTMAEDTLDRIKEVEGVRDAAGMVGGCSPGSSRTAARSRATRARCLRRPARDPKLRAFIRVVRDVLKD